MQSQRETMTDSLADIINLIHQDHRSQSRSAKRADSIQLSQCMENMPFLLY